MIRSSILQSLTYFLLLKLHTNALVTLLVISAHLRLKRHIEQILAPHRIQEEIFEPNWVSEEDKN